MKHIRLTLDDKDFKIALKNKGKRTWKEVVMGEQGK